MTTTTRCGFRWANAGAESRAAPDARNWRRAICAPRPNGPRDVVTRPPRPYDWGSARVYTDSEPVRRLRIPQQRLEPEIHVLLNMAVKQSWSRLIGGKVHARASVSRHHDSILNHARRCLPVNLGDLQLVPMQMQRMRIVGAVMERQPVPGPLLEQKLLIVRVGFPIH